MLLDWTGEFDAWLDKLTELIAWFPPEEGNTVVVALFAGDKARMGDVFYDSVGTRADAAIASYLHAIEGEDHD